MAKEKTQKMIMGFPAKLIDDLKALSGLPPYNGSSNIVEGDGYFAMSIERQWGKKLMREATRAVIVPMQREIDAAASAIGKKYS